MALKWYFMLLTLTRALECNTGFCDPKQLNDGWCDPSCNILPCFLDIATDALVEPLAAVFESSDCFIDCIIDCKQPLLTNSVCDSECDSATCGYG
mmetsp:Transcript_30142/g.53421  ORF Transcript_30142/g.53421 Transcript_30142/m.53421 type:complete len:95 (-) Transcript_30142:79-363(-)